MRSGAVSKGCGAAGRCARRRLTWSQCPSLAKSCGRTLFIRFGGNLGAPCVQLAYRERRGDCRRGGTWLLAAWLILSRKVPFAGPEDRHESGLRKAVATRSAARLARPRPLARSPALPSSPCARSVRSRGDRERGGGRMEREVQERRGLREGSGGGRPTPGEGLTRRRAKMNGGAAAGGGQGGARSRG